jgi:hypothetical protein
VTTLQAAMQQLDAADIAATDAPTTTCPEWCELPDGHPWMADITPGAVCRIHSLTVWRSAPGSDAHVVTLDLYEAIGADGMPDTDCQVGVNLTGPLGDDSAVLLAAADAIAAAKARIAQGAP